MTEKFKLGHYRLYRKMEVHTTLEAVLLAIGLGLVPCPCGQRVEVDCGYYGA